MPAEEQFGPPAPRSATELRDEAAHARGLSDFIGTRMPVPRCAILPPSLTPRPSPSKPRPPPKQSDGCLGDGANPPADKGQYPAIGAAWRGNRLG